MDDDLNISGALASIFEFVKEINSFMMDSKVGKNNGKNILEAMENFDLVLGILDTKDEKLDLDIKKMIDQREKARKGKDFEKADQIRDELKEKGIILEDTKDGVRWKKIA